MSYGAQLLYILLLLQGSILGTSHRGLFSAGPPPTTVTEDGTGYTITGAGVQVLTLSSMISTGQGVVLFIAAANSSAVVGCGGACVDNAGNVYTVDVTANTTNIGLGFSSTHATSGPISTITLDLSGGNNVIHVFLVNNFRSTSWTGVSGSHVGAGTTIATATASGPISGISVAFQGCIVSPTTVTQSNDASYANLVVNSAHFSRTTGAAWKEYFSGTPSASCHTSASAGIVAAVQAYLE